MVNHLLGFGFPHLGIKQGRVSAFRELFTTLATAQQTKVIFAINLSNGEIALMGAPKILAFDVDTG